MKCSIIDHAARVRELASLLEDFVVLFVVRDRKLVGSITNGDFRRGIARGVTLEDTVPSLMNPAPLYVDEHDDFETRLARVRRLPAKFRFLPEISSRGEVLRIVSDKALISVPNCAVIMAGGLGSRLKALTANTPKPMLRIGDRPILHLILEQLRRAGISRFYISIHYRGDVIKDYFGDGSDFGVSISYIDEKQRLGTAGCLSLLPDKQTHPLFVMNADILTEMDPHAVLGHHERTRAAATVCLHQYHLQVPYGVVREHGGLVRAIEEKPVAIYNVSAGIYVLNPDCLPLVPRGKSYDMPSLLDNLVARGLPLAAYPLPGPWIDIGNIDDFHRAATEYQELLGRI